nr:nascent polypeptide-associated complex subunit alpha, muscle-specific form-like [Aegilops tauschii subsp. strangulata]
MNLVAIVPSSSPNHGISKSISSRASNRPSHPPEALFRRLGSKLVPADPGRTRRPGGRLGAGTSQKGAWVRPVGESSASSRRFFPLSPTSLPFSPFLPPISLPLASQPAAMPSKKYVVLHAAATATTSVTQPKQRKPRAPSSKPTGMTNAEWRAEVQRREAVTADRRNRAIAKKARDNVACATAAAASADQAEAEATRAGMMNPPGSHAQYAPWGQQGVGSPSQQPWGSPSPGYADGDAHGGFNPNPAYASSPTPPLCRGALPFSHLGDTDLAFLLGGADMLQSNDEAFKAWYLAEHGLILNQLPSRTPPTPTLTPTPLPSPSDDAAETPRSTEATPTPPSTETLPSPRTPTSPTPEADLAV